MVDLDGTLALNQHRHHFIDTAEGGRPDWDSFFLACDKDLPSHQVIDVVNLFSEKYKIHIFSARGMIAFDKTRGWLSLHKVKYDDLKMREIGDYTPDDELKKKWLEELYPHYKQEVFLVLDDRDKVVKMWRNA